MRFGRRDARKAHWHWRLKRRSWKSALDCVVGELEIEVGEMLEIEELVIGVGEKFEIGDSD